jgi:Co/Zn/Cd efflux system component
MKNNILDIVCDAVERISNATETNDIPAIVDALIGLAWNEEEAWEIKSYHNQHPE